MTKPDGFQNTNVDVFKLNLFDNDLEKGKIPPSPLVDPVLKNFLDLSYEWFWVKIIEPQ